MKIRIYFLSIVFTLTVFAITFFPQLVFSDASHDHEKSHDRSEVMNITDSRISPNRVTLAKGGSSVFFLNSSSSSSFKLKIDYGKKVAHCASGKMEMNDEGVFASLNSVSSGEFISVCFPMPGQYPVKIVFENGKVSKALVSVE